MTERTFACDLQGMFLHGSDPDSRLHEFYLGWLKTAHYFCSREYSKLPDFQ